MRTFVDFVCHNELKLGKGLYSDYALFQPNIKDGVYLHHYTFFCPARAVYPRTTDMVWVDTVVRRAFHFQCVPIYQYDNDKLAFYNGVYDLLDHSFRSHTAVDKEVVCRQLMHFDYNAPQTTAAIATPVCDYVLRSTTDASVYGIIGDSMRQRPNKTTLLIGGDDVIRREIVNAVYSTFHGGDCDFIRVGEKMAMCADKPAFVAIEGFEHQTIPDEVLQYANIGAGHALPKDYNADLVNIVHLQCVRAAYYPVIRREICPMVCRCVASVLGVAGNPK